MPKPASDFINLRSDGYYPDYIICHKRLSKKQDDVYRSKKQLELIDCIAEKADNLKQYTSRAWRDLSSYDYDKIEKIIKNDERMLTYLQCEKILEPQNDRFRSQRKTYQICLENLEDIKNLITGQKSPDHEKYKSQPIPESENKPKSDSLDFGF